MTDHTTPTKDGRTLTVRVPLALRKRGGRKLVVTPEDAPPWAPPRARVDNAMVKALARAGRRAIRAIRRRCSDAMSTSMSGDCHQAVAVAVSPSAMVI